jgi:uncharacterized integral membrane protein
MYASLIITFLLLLGIIIAGIQNSMPVELKFLTWKLHMSLMALIFYASLFGGAIVAVLALPKLVAKYLKVRKLNREVYELKKRTVELEEPEAESL